MVLIKQLCFAFNWSLFSFILQIMVLYVFPLLQSFWACSSLLAEAFIPSNKSSLDLPFAKLNRRKLSGFGCMRCFNCMSVLCNMSVYSASHMTVGTTIVWVLASPMQCKMISLFLCCFPEMPQYQREISLLSPPSINPISDSPSDWRAPTSGATSVPRTPEPRGWWKGQGWLSHGVVSWPSPAARAQFQLSSCKFTPFPIWERPVCWNQGKCSSAAPFINHVGSSLIPPCSIYMFNLLLLLFWGFSQMLLPREMLLKCHCHSTAWPFPASACVAFVTAPRCSLLPLQGETCSQTPAVWRQITETSCLFQMASSGCDLDPAARFLWIELVWGPSELSYF